MAVPIPTAFEAALYLAVWEAGIGTSELARRLAVVEQEARRLLDPCHGSKAAALVRAPLAVGRRLALEVQAAA